MIRGHLKVVLKEDARCTTNLALGLYFVFNEELTGLHSGLRGVAKFRQEVMPCSVPLSISTASGLPVMRIIEERLVG